MMEPLVAALALALGLVLGYGAGAVRGLRLVAQRRAAAGYAAAIGRILPDRLPERSVTDMIAGQVRLALGGQLWDLPLLPRKAARDWVAKVDLSWKSLGDAMEAASDDTPAIVALLMGHQDQLLAMIREFDVTGVLPEPEWIDEYVTDAEVFLAAIELWRATHPLAAAVVETASQPTTPSGSTPEPRSTSRRRTAGDPTTSTAD